jgi:hypothetical protein
MFLDSRPETPEVESQPCSMLEKTTDIADFPALSSPTLVEDAEAEEERPEWGLEDLETEFQWRNNKFRWMVLINSLYTNVNINLYEIRLRGIRKGIFSRDFGVLFLFHWIVFVIL